MVYSTLLPSHFPISVVTRLKCKLLACYLELLWDHCLVQGHFRHWWKEPGVKPPTSSTQRIHGLLSVPTKSKVTRLDQGLSEARKSNVCTCPCSFWLINDVILVILVKAEFKCGLQLIPVVSRWQQRVCVLFLV